MQGKSLLRILLIALLLVALEATRTLAGTTGGISGRVVDTNGNSIAAAEVTASSPSQTAKRTTDAKGYFVILGLSPDTYTVSVAKTGYDTSTVLGVTVQADQTTSANVTVNKTAKILGRVVTTAQASVVNRSVTGDLYAVNQQAVSDYQGSAGGNEALNSQSGIVGSLPGVVRQIGIGGGYQQGQGTLSLRGGAYDQVGFELEGIMLNRGFDFYNATSFLTNGVSSLEVYTGGQPASEGRAMSGYVNALIRRGSYPTKYELTASLGTPAANHTINFAISGGTPNNKFTWFITTLGMYNHFTFGDPHDLDNFTQTVPANDVGCAQFQAAQGLSSTDWPCDVSHSYGIPISVGAWFPNGSPINPSTNTWDTIVNLHWTFEHNGLNDELQAFYNVGYTYNPYKYSGPSIDPTINAFTLGGFDYPSVCGLFPPLTPTEPCAGSQILWPTGALYHGSVSAPYDPSKIEVLAWPGAGNSTGPIPSSYIDNQWTQSAIEKLSYTRVLTPTSFLRLFGYALYSLWSIDQATNGFIGGTFYQLHDNAIGVTLNYQNQLNAQHLLRVDADYTHDKTLRYNYGNWLPFNNANRGRNYGPAVMCFPSIDCSPGDTVAAIGSPYGFWSDTTPIFSDFVIADQWKPNDKFAFDLGLRWDQFRFRLMPLQITGPNGLAMQGEANGQCLLGYNYSASDPALIGYRVPGTTTMVYPVNCFEELTNLYGPAGQDIPDFLPGHANWTDASGDLTFTQVSPRFGMTFAASPTDVFRLSVGRYVQPPSSAFEEYRAAPFWPGSDTVSVLNRFYRGLRFLAVHNVKPEDSTNWDLSWEHDFGNGLSGKLTPYFRTTRGQILNTPVGLESPSFVTGYNYGTARIKGAEFLLRMNRQHENGWSGALALTYTDSKIKFLAGPTGKSLIDDFNTAISDYNTAHGTSYPLEDRNGYYAESFTLAAGDVTPTWDVRWVANLNLDYRVNGWDILPSFNYQSGNSYGDPLQFPDADGLVGFGPDPYTHNFDPLGSLKGPSFWTINLGVSRELSKNTKITALITNLVTQVNNHGYPWEYPTDKQVISYGDNTFYSQFEMAGMGGVYNGEGYYPYGPNTMMPLQQLTVTISTKL